MAGTCPKDGKPCAAAGGGWRCQTAACPQADLNNSWNTPEPRPAGPMELHDFPAERTIHGDMQIYTFGWD